MAELVYETCTPYEAFMPPRPVSRKELAFRCAANLCVNCGMAKPEPESVVCFECREAREIENARIQRRVWGIAA